MERVLAFLDPTDDLVVLQRQDALDDAGAVAAVVEVVGMFHEVVQVQRIGMAVLAAVRYAPAGTMKIVVQEVVEIVVGAMKTHRTDHLVVRNGLCALAELVRLDDVRNRVLGRAGAIGVVVMCLVERDPKEDVVTAALRFFRIAAVGSEGNKSDIVWNGGLEWCMAYVDKWNQQHLADWCVLIRNLTVGRTDIAVVIADMDVVPKLVKALTKLSHLYDVVVNILVALFQIVSAHEDNANKFVQCQGWELVLCDLMQTYFDRWRVQTLVAGIVEIVAVQNHQHAQILVSVGMIALMLKAMHTHVTRRGLLYYAAKAVRILFLKTGQGMDQLRECGGVDTLLDILYCSVARPITDTNEICTGYADVI